MNPIAKWLISSGVLLIALGIFWHWGGKAFHLGRLPGDIAIEKENFKFYFPLTTSILVSLLASLLFYLVGWLSKK